jgi:uncharacterized protein
MTDITLDKQPNELGGLDIFEQKLQTMLNDLHEKGIDTSEFQIDHICYRVESISRADIILERLRTVDSSQKSGETFGVANINGRPIYIIELPNPIQILGRDVRYVELPYPKPESNYSEGFEHIEFILPAETVINTIDDVALLFQSYFPEANLSRLDGERYKVEFDSPTAGSDQLPNPTVSIKFRDLDISIKFHAISIAHVIKGLDYKYD